MVSFGDETRRRTRWGQNTTARASAGCQSEKRRDDAHPGGGMGPREHQQGVIRRRDETTHKLVVEWGHESVSGVPFGDQIRRRTYWGRNRAMRASAGWPSETRREDAHPRGKTDPREHHTVPFGEQKKRRTTLGRTSDARVSAGPHSERGRDTQTGSRAARDTTVSKISFDKQMTHVLQGVKRPQDRQKGVINIVPRCPDVPSRVWLPCEMYSISLEADVHPPTGHEAYTFIEFYCRFVHHKTTYILKLALTCQHSCYTPTSNQHTF